ncbi:MAG TPA: YdcF family protein [Myxococcales bacterium]|nr:YdcF family protein [Myxococcales bacterium]
MRRVRFWLLALAGIAVGGVLAAPLALQAAGRFLVVSDPIAPADAIYVFPGEVPHRAGCGAELFRAGVAPRVVLSGSKVHPSLAAVGISLSDAQVNAHILQGLDVPMEAITVLNEGTSTREDAEALRHWAAGQAQVHRVVAITSPAHSRRAKQTLDAVFRGSPVDVHIRSCPEGLGPDWWHDEESLLQVTNEYLKMLYYVLAY